MPSFRVNLQWATISEVIPNLYISGVTALKPTELRALDIALIVNCTNEVPNLKMAEVERIKLWIDDVDDEDIGQHFDQVTERMHEYISCEQRVLVHCVAGVSRSATIVLAYLLKYRCRCLREAYHLLSERRPMVRPNLGFWRYLISWEQLIKKAPGSVRLVWTKHQDDENQSLMPDVYFPIVVPPSGGDTSADSTKENGDSSNPYIVEGRQRRWSGQSGKFVPQLVPLPEDLILDSVSVCSSDSSIACNGGGRRSPDLSGLLPASPAPATTSNSAQPAVQPV